MIHLSRFVEFLNFLKVVGFFIIKSEKNMLQLIELRLSCCRSISFILITNIKGKHICKERYKTKIAICINVLGIVKVTYNKVVIEIVSEVLKSANYRVKINQIAKCKSTGF